jgi:HD superfamily phosphohydrolase
MSSTRDFDVVRDPLWNNIRLDRRAMAVLDTPAVQRLRYVRQLGHAFLVYPGATHSRFEHALGAYHLAKTALAALGERDELAHVTPEQCEAVRLAALLHDIGHYPFSHALEEAGFPSHERLGVARLERGELAHVLEEIGPGFGAEVGRLITGDSTSPLGGLITGSIDLDKIDYLSRDAFMCGVPYGTVDVDRLLASLTLVDAGDGRREVGVHEKGVSALESLLFAKYQMYRNVYWHHAVRAATCMFKRAVRDAVRAGAISAESVSRATDDEVMVLLEKAGSTLARAVRARRLHKRALELPASDVPADAQEWVSEDPALAERVEDALAREVGLAPGELLIDYPSRASMLGVDLPLLTRDGRVERLTDRGRAGTFGLPAVAPELYRSARRLRVFTAQPVTADLSPVLELLTLPADDITRVLQESRPLLSRRSLSST